MLLPTQEEAIASAKSTLGAIAADVGAVENADAAVHKPLTELAVGIASAVAARQNELNTLVGGCYCCAIRVRQMVVVKGTKWRVGKHLRPSGA